MSGIYLQGQLEAGSGSVRWKVKGVGCKEGLVQREDRECSLGLDSHAQLDLR